MAADVMNRSERQAVIERMLFHEPGGVRVVALADACGVDRRTIYRDLAQLRAKGVPLYQKAGRFFVSREYYLASVGFTVHETLALFLAVRVFAQLSTPQNPHLVSALSRLSRVLPEAMANHALSVEQMLLQTPIDRLFVVVMEKLTRAWSERRWVQMWYHHEPDPIRFAAYFMDVNRRGHLYVVGWDDNAQAIRAFQVQRITRIELQRAVFDQKPPMNTGQYLADAAGYIRDEQPGDVEVEIALTPQAARLHLRERLSTLTRREKLPDGRDLVVLRVRAWEELMPWLRSIAAEAEVLAPMEMRAAIRDEIERLSRRYGMGQVAEET